MNLYSNKQRWKIALLLLALGIAGVSMWYTDNIADTIRAEEREKALLWSQAIQRKAELVNFTEDLFESLREEERKKADLWVKSVNMINSTRDDVDLTFVIEVLFSNQTIPVLLFDDNERLVNHANLPPYILNNASSVDSLKEAILTKRPPIEIKVAARTQYLYYDDSFIFSQLQDVMEDLITSFISETVVNAASVPVIMTDSTGTQIVAIGNIDSPRPEDSLWVATKLAEMAAQNQPIEITLPEQGKRFIYYSDSYILKQLQYFPIIQLSLIAVFLIVSYLVFSTYRKAEQNQVWVGMAKETAHQLGTPLSSLMAWVEIMRSQGLDNQIAEELNKDIQRLEIITERFSKIGSKPDYQTLHLSEAVDGALSYMRSRIPGKVRLTVFPPTLDPKTEINQALFGWVIENLIKNAVDAMEAQGTLEISMGMEGKMAFVDITDSGKGIPKGKFKTVFQPGFTTKKRGWGLGLSLTKRIIENYHRGSIFVKSSSPSGGTTFRILLRVAEIKS